MASLAARASWCEESFTKPYPRFFPVALSRLMDTDITW